ncbi:type III secretion system cytoplasmic ring protein SctQ, partial [Stenotrophomonas sp.]|uniref:type III secretion system cytoplasmic ring protein SctQ n=1 Tax=Stenotrophomonas sp. TaxID=69392 RepID=UPI002FC6F9CE
AATTTTRQHAKAVQQAQAHAVALCQGAGITPSWAPRPADAGLLYFRLQAEALELDVAMPADSWGAAHWPSLAGLAWSAMAAAGTTPPPSQGALLQPLDPALAQAEVSWRPRPATPAAHDAAPAPALDTAQGLAWIDHARWRGGPSGSALPLPPVSLPLTLHVARLRLGLARLRQLKPGAVLLIDQLRPCAQVGRAALFAFDFTLETITVTNLLDLIDDDLLGETAPVAAAALPDQPAAAMPGLDVSRLPVNVEVVLCQVPQTVAELAALQPGTVFTLPDNAWLSLQLRVNGQPIGSGELVQVGDQLGVQLHHAPRLP